MLSPRTRSALSAFLLLLVPTSSLVLGQSQPGVHAASPVRNAGVYHVATGTWTRKASQASISDNVVFDNTCSSGYFMALEGDTITDEGRLPSPTSPTSTDSLQGTTTSYTINGFQIAYCTDQPNLGVVTVDFRQSHPVCAPIAGVPTTATFAISGLPGSPAGQSCWTATLDLDSIQLPPLTFAMQGDGDGSYEGAVPSGDDRFAWSMRCSLPAGQQSLTGPLIAGAPLACPPATGGTGIGSLDSFRIDTTGSYTGCHFFGGYPAYPFASFHLQLFAREDEPGTVPGEPICVGDGVAPHTACPCANNSSPAAAVGCLNSFGAGGRLRGSGVASLGAEAAGQAHLTLTADQLPSSAPALLFQGTNAASSGNGTVLGDGLRCAVGTVTRIGTRTASGGSVAWPPPAGPFISVQGGVLTPGTRVYQAWYRNSASFCTPSAFNFTNGLTIAWAP